MILILNMTDCDCDEGSSKVWNVTSEQVWTNIERAGHLLMDTMAEAGIRVTSTIATPSGFLGDITNIRWNYAHVHMF